MTVPVAIACGVLGFLLGSWLRVVVARTPMRQSLRRPGAHCPTCGTSLTGRQRNALAAQALGKNRCGTCKNQLWSKTPILEIMTAALFSVAVVRLGVAWALPAYLVFFAAVAAITVIDLQHYLIPNRIVYPALFASLAIFVATAIFHHQAGHLWRALICMAGAWLFFFVVWFVNPRGLGFGDVRLAALIGLHAGWLGYSNVILSIILGLLLAAGSGIVLMALRLRGRKDAIPFGPFLVAGAVVAIFWGGPIIDWYNGASCTAGHASTVQGCSVS